MKQKKISESHWRVTASDGSYADLVLKEGKGWIVHVYVDGKHANGGTYRNRFEAKITAERILSETLTSP